MISDRIAEDADWKDGINQFRIRILEELKEINVINKKIENLQQKIKEKTP